MTPIKLRNFRGEVDSTFYDAETGNLEVLAKTTNLTPFRKRGSLVQCPGFTEHLDIASLPSVEGYSIVDMFTFSVDRENKELTLIVLQNETDTKIFINSWWNPSSAFYNYRYDKTASSWIDEWIELTENLKTINDNPITVDTIADVVITISDDFPNEEPYYSQWFVLNKTREDSEFGAKFGMVVSQVNDNQFVVDSDTWQEGDVLEFYRFPVRALYGVLPNDLNYDNLGNDFFPTPTQFIPGQNQLRIACGKEDRPLIVEDIYERKYLQGSRPYNYDGIWFDFQQPQQVLRGSAISSYGDDVAAASTEFVYIDTETLDCFVGVAPAYKHIKIKYTGSSTETIRIKGVASQAEPVIYEYSGEHVFKIRYESIGNCTTATLQAAMAEALGSVFEVTHVNGDGTLGTFHLAHDDAESFVYGGVTTSGYDAGGNTLATNIFLGSQVQAMSYNAVDDPANRIITTLLLDNRNEVLISHGNICVEPTGILEGGIKVWFNSWFSRKITHIKLYSGTKAVLSSAGVNAIPKYPFFAWAKGYEINLTPLLITFPFGDLFKPINGEINANLGLHSLTNGFNCFARSDGMWFTHITQETANINEQGDGLRFLVSCNRWIDQDITMNYTRGVFTGQTNGRNFVIGCQNKVEEELFKNDDLVLMSNYAAGVASYDVFLRDRNLQVNLGNKDINREITFNRGSLTVIKDNNIYLIDINQRSEINYRIVDTSAGRGTTKYDSVCNTPYGTIICSSDTVWLATTREVVPLLTETNGRLQLYRDKFANKEVKCIYYNQYDELMIFVTDQPSRENNTSYVLVYSFRAKFWTHYEYVDSINPLKVITNSDKQVLILNKGEDNYNILVLDEESSNFIDVDGEDVPIHWEVEIQAYPLLDNKDDAILEWIKFGTDYNSENIVLKVTATFDNDVEQSIDYLTFNDTSDVVLRNALTLNLYNNILFQYLTINITNRDNVNAVQPMKYLSLNNILIFISRLLEKKSVD